MALVLFACCCALTWCVCFRLYVPEFSSSLSVSVADCSGGGSDAGSCPLVLRLGSASLQHGPVMVNCSGTACSAALSQPPWDTWLRVDVESGHDNRSFSFTLVSNYTGDSQTEASEAPHTRCLTASVCSSGL